MKEVQGDSDGWSCPGLKDAVLGSLALCGFSWLGGGVVSWHGLGWRVGWLAVGTWPEFSVFVEYHVFHDLLFQFLAFWRSASVCGLAV